MIKLKALKRKRIIHLYHYRSSAKQNVEELIKKGKVYIDLFTNSKSMHFFVGFTQKIVNTNSDRRIDYTILEDKSTLFFNLYTTKYWEGDDLNRVFAIDDDDLIKQMLDQIDLSITIQ